MDEFIKSKSMLSSGVLGTTTTMIAGTMATQFDIPGDLTAIVVSFLLGLLVFTDQSIPYLQRGVFYIIISLIIFTTAMGINAAGIAATRSSEQPRVLQRGIDGEEGKNFFHDWFSALDSVGDGKLARVNTMPGQLKIERRRPTSFVITELRGSARRTGTGWVARGSKRSPLFG